MSRIQEVASLIEEGYSPLEIERKIGVSFSSVRSYLNSAVGHDLIKASDILFTIPEEQKEAFELIITKSAPADPLNVAKKVAKSNKRLSVELFEYYLELRNKRVPSGDMYEAISEIEILRHKSIKSVLVSKFGESNWWRNGISPSIRKICDSLWEDDTEPASEPYCSTTFIHLQDILDKNWVLFSDYLPRNLVKDKKGFLGEFVSLNHIRNLVMHPVKGIQPSADDFSFVRKVLASIQKSEWQSFPK